MSFGKYTKRLFGVLIALSLLVILACGSAEEADPTATPTATPIPAMPTFDVGQPTPTPPPPAPGEPTPTPVTSVPAPADTPTPVPVPGEEPEYGGVVNLPPNGQC